jgi:hypothetical protein
MNLDDKKMMISDAELVTAQKAFTAAQEEFLDMDRIRTNVVGMGVGTKWKDGRPTGEPALVVLVTHKVEKDQLSKADLVPNKLEGLTTDVLAIGFPTALALRVPTSRAMSYPTMDRGDGFPEVEEGVQPEISPFLLAKRVRPAKGGYSVGHFRITAGTIATCVYDILPGGGVAPPSNGVGIPPRFYVLSNNHVLANSNAAALGDAILQPGPFDGGVDPMDRIATLSRFVPITFEPPVPRALHRNIVDAAVAEGQFHDLDREVHSLGRIEGWRRKTDPRTKPGVTLKKVGRTTNLSFGRITVLNATVDVGYGAGRVARFRDQIVTTNMAAGGDSGSLVTTLDNIAVGLLFAGSANATIINHIENVRALLRVEVADEIK